MGTARKKRDTKAEQVVTDYHHEEARRLNIPLAGLAAQGKIREKPKIRYAYNPHLPPVLRFDRTGKADGLPELLETARTRNPNVAYFISNRLNFIDISPLLSYNTSQIYI